MNRRPTWSLIDLDNLIENFKSSRRFVGEEIRYMGVVKADAYGHGAVECAKALEKSGIDWLAVALPEEAVELRLAGLKAPILCLGGFWSGQEELILEYDLTPVVFQIEKASLLNLAAAKRKVSAPIHVKIDTGMGRVGLRWDSLPDFLVRLKNLENLRVEGLMTHFAAADDPAENDFTRIQTERFEAAVILCESAGFSLIYKDLANSPGAVAHPSARGNMVRLGGILYGLSGDVLPPGIDRPELRPVMSLHSRIALLKVVPGGESLGYGRTCILSRDSVIASVPIGYEDGLPRSLSNLGSVIINGLRAPIVGRISMDWTLVDVTDLPNVKVDDEVILIGNSGDQRQTAEEIARQAGTISYEITCGIGKRVNRIYAGG